MEWEEGVDQELVPEEGREEGVEVVGREEVAGLALRAVGAVSERAGGLEAPLREVGEKALHVVAEMAALEPDPAPVEEYVVRVAAVSPAVVAAVRSRAYRQLQHFASCHNRLQSCPHLPHVLLRYAPVASRFPQVQRLQPLFDSRCLLQRTQALARHWLLFYLSSTNNIPF